MERKELKKAFPEQTYSEVFRKQVVKEFEQGLYTKSELRRRYILSQKDEQTQ